MEREHDYEPLNIYCNHCGELVVNEEDCRMCGEEIHGDTSECQCQNCEFHREQTHHVTQEDDNANSLS